MELFIWRWVSTTIVVRVFVHCARWDGCLTNFSSVSSTSVDDTAYVAQFVVTIVYIWRSSISRIYTWNQLDTDTIGCNELDSQRKQFTMLCVCVCFPIWFLTFLFVHFGFEENQPTKSWVMQMTHVITLYMLVLLYIYLCLPICASDCHWNRMCQFGGW